MQAHTPGIGAVFVISSLSAPISAFYKVGVNPKGGTEIAVPLTTSNADAAALDNLIFARATKKDTLVGVQAPYTATDATIASQLSKAFVYMNVYGSSPYHFLEGFLTTPWWDVTNNQTGDAMALFYGDYVTAYYPGGYTEKWEFLGIDKSGVMHWARVPKSLMNAQGKPVTPPSTLPAKPLAGYGSEGGTTTWPAGHVLTESDLNLCSGTSSIEVIDPATGVPTTSYGVFAYPC